MPKLVVPKYSALGWWEDDRLPDIADLLSPHEVNQPAFCNWLAPLLEEYRGRQSVEDGLPSRREEVSVLSALKESMKATRARLQRSALPPLLEPRLAAHAFKRGRNWEEMRADLVARLVEMNSIVVRVERELAPARGGRPNENRRHILLSEVFERLGSGVPKATQRYQLASEILRRCEVHVPAPSLDGDTHAIEKAERKGRKLRTEEESHRRNPKLS